MKTQRNYNQETSGARIVGHALEDTTSGRQEEADLNWRDDVLLRVHGGGGAVAGRAQLVWVGERTRHGGLREIVALSLQALPRSGA